MDRWERDFQFSNWKSVIACTICHWLIFCKFVGQKPSDDLGDLYGDPYVVHARIRIVIRRLVAS